jgi:two-component system, NtrC family, response regulator HydG
VEKTLRDVLQSYSDAPASGPTSTFQIEVVAGPDQGARLEITSGRMLIGTSHVCNLVLTDERVSRRHLAVSLEGDTLRLEDLASTNGTFTDDLRITGAYLKGGEKITIGKSLLHVTASASSQKKTPMLAVSFGRVLGASAAMQRVYEIARRVAASDIPCTVEGETGTGKEQLAEAIHEASPRAQRPFVVFDCTAVPGNLMESALFGHEKGSFTGAAGTRHGVFEQADGGTLFIDEIGDLDLALQPKLLRAIQRGEVQRVGGSGWIKTNVRVLAATRRDLDREVQAGRFRDDLFFRLAVARIELPPLRERGADVELLARSFWASLGPRAGAFPTEFLTRYHGHAWPGNVRELLNTVVRWQALGEIGLAELGTSGPAPEAPSAPAAPDFVARLIQDDVPFSKARQLAAQDFERRYVQSVLEKYDGNVTKAAQASGIGRRYFHMLLAKLENTT